VTRKVILAVIDGLTPAMLEGALETRSLPTLASLVEHGAYGRATSTFPSLTPVCLSSIATGAHSDVHEIPHLVWWHRGERRIVEYGSSFGAARAAGLTRTLRDTLVGLNAEHLGKRAVTIFEALADAGKVTAAVNFTAYRGRTPHRSVLRPLGTVLGPEQFFFYNLFESAKTGAPLSWRNRQAGTIDRYATAAGRWLVTRDAFDFFLFYLSDYDYASHAAGPDAALDVLVRCDDAIGELVAAAGGLEAFLDRYAILVIADHGQTHVKEIARLRPCFEHDPATLVTASNRAASIYRLDETAPSARQLAERLDGEASVEVVAFAEDGAVVARRDGAELRLVQVEGALTVEGDSSILDHPDAPTRLWTAVRCPNAGDVVVSATEGWEFADMGDSHHLGGGSHGSLVAADSVVPMIAVGLDLPAKIVDVAPTIVRSLTS
jgi:hypothetical protein